MFCACVDFVGNKGADGFAEDIFLDEDGGWCVRICGWWWWLLLLLFLVAEFEAGGQVVDVFCQFVVEKWSACFETVGHFGAVAEAG